MRTNKSVWKIIYKLGVTCVYIAMIIVLIVQALTPGNESSNISNSVGGAINDIVTEIQKPEAERIEVTALSIDGLLVEKETLSASEDITLNAGTSGSLQCTITPSDASNQSLNYFSSDEDVVIVYGDGTIEAKSMGTACIIVIPEDNPNIQSSITIKVKGIPLKEIALNLSPANFYPNKTYGLDITYSPSNTTERGVTLTSSNEDVITISTTGELLTHATGVATITATSDVNEKITASVTVTVVAEPEPEKVPVKSVNIQSIKVNSSSLSLSDPVISIGATGKMQSTVSPSNASNKSLHYSSSDTSVLEVYSDGTIKAKKAGKAIVTVVSDDNDKASASITITVGEIEIQSIQLSANKSSIYVGQSLTIEVSYTPKNTTQKEVTWTSSDKNVLTVSASGTIKAVAAGTAVVTATSKTNAQIIATITIEVQVKPDVPEIPVTSLTVKQNGGIGYVKTTETLSCTVFPSNATYKSVVWSSSDKTIATVNQSGRVTFLKAGTVTITAKSSSYDIKDSVTITVKEVLSQSISLTLENATKNEEGEYTMKVATAASIIAALDKNATILTVDFSSSNPEIAEVGQDGNVEAHKKGTVTITASTSYDGKTTSASFNLTVVGLTPDVESINLEHAHEYAQVGANCTLSANFYPLTSTDTLSWSSSDPEIAAVTQGGTVTYRKAGTVTITVKCSSYDVETSITVTVKEVLSKSIGLYSEGFHKDADGRFTIKIAKSGKVKATLDQNATVRNVEFSSSNPKIASIGQDGVIEALSAGTVTITVSTSYDGETTSTSFELTVIGYSFSDQFENFYLWVRKSFGHFGAFLLLGIFATLTYHTHFPKGTKGKIFGFIVCLAAGFAVAGITEIFQLPYFTAGRHCSFDDVLLDFRGYCCSTIPMYAFILIMHFIKFIPKKKSPNIKNESKPNVTDVSSI